MSPLDVQKNTRVPFWTSRQERLRNREGKKLTGKAFIVEIARWWKCVVSWWIYQLKIGPTYMSVRPQAYDYYFASYYYHRNERLEIPWFATSHRSTMSAMKLG